MNFLRFPPVSRLPRTLAWKIASLFLVAGLLLGGGGCVAPEKAPLQIPLTYQRHDLWSNAPKRDKTLLVFLPGRGTSGRDFVRQGFLRSIAPPAVPPAAKTGPPVDAVTVDLTFPYYMQRVATRRLHDDVIVPLRAEGYRRIWLVGCSVGGLGAIFYDYEHPGIVTGIVAIAPYLGDKDVAAEIEAGGGLDRWQPNPRAIAEGDFRRELWLAIRQGRYGQPGHVPLVLAYGKGDRFVAGQDLFATRLPPERVFKTFGFHDWGTWRNLWKTVLASRVSPLSEPMSVKPRPRR